MSIFFGVMVFLTQRRPFARCRPSFAAFGKARCSACVSPLLLVSVAVAVLLVVLYRSPALGREMLAAGAKARGGGAFGRARRPHLRHLPHAVGRPRRASPR